MNSEEFTAFLAELFGQGSWPKPLHLLHGASLVDGGNPLPTAARRVGTSVQRIAHVCAADDRVLTVLGSSPTEIDTKHRQRAASTLGQLLLGRAAELAFEAIYRDEMHSHELELRDLRESRTDTDYRLYNVRGHAVYRIKTTLLETGQAKVVTSSSAANSDPIRRPRGRAGHGCRRRSSGPWP